MGNFKGWHIVAGAAAMAVAAPLGSAMGLNFVATFMFACVVFVAVAMWTESKIARRREARVASFGRTEPRHPARSHRPAPRTAPCTS
ncbi:hypothetical protein MG599_20290 [Paenarthrobacter sp. SD-1]|uniref:Uncharacterized protein n=1 Tax=Paenarthrobacter ureafaciens TaxID=37931 RepID=A0AAX3EHG0_PAEUR|nr:MULTISPECIES: hypothetical protein [Paenarthrobacter]MDO5877616.1 hypothetical protein [Paenarthrobacter sp. SD-1]UYV97335.1 hypothetical protein NL394_20250 [Paenarthrobacter ureafaciens]